MKRKKMWVFSGVGKSKIKLSELDKIEIENRCQPLVERFKQQYIKKNPNRRYNYLVDIYTKWKGNYLYFCEKYKSEQTGMIDRDFEEKFVRLEYAGNDSFKFAYFRHTGQWFLVTTGLTLNNCLEMIESNPNFHPIG